MLDLKKQRLNFLNSMPAVVKTPTIVPEIIQVNYSLNYAMME
jgi:hypothetical protein